MKNLEKLDNFEKEYYSEIREMKIPIEELKKVGISDKLLSCEAYLYKLYGDEIILAKSDDNVDSKLKRTVTRIGEEDFNVDKGYRSICGDIENSEFDKNLEVLTTTLGKTE